MNPSDPLHEVKNQLSIVIGFADLLIAETEDADIRHEDLLELRRAACRALALLPELRNVSER